MEKFSVDVVSCTHQLLRNNLLNHSSLESSVFTLWFMNVYLLESKTEDDVNWSICGNHLFWPVLHHLIFPFCLYQLTWLSCAHVHSNTEQLSGFMWEQLHNHRETVRSMDRHVDRLVLPLLQLVAVPVRASGKSKHCPHPKESLLAPNAVRQVGQSERLREWK